VSVVVQPSALLAEMKGLRDKGYFLLVENRKWGKERRYRIVFWRLSVLRALEHRIHRSRLLTEKKFSFVSGNNSSIYLLATNFLPMKQETTYE
jgi:hypothetical protein